MVLNSQTKTLPLGKPGDDFGELLCPAGGDGFWNVWTTCHEKAREIRQEQGGYLLAYRRHFFVVGKRYIEFLGLDPGDSAWSAMDHDWAQPKDVAARERLCTQLLGEA